MKHLINIAIAIFLFNSATAQLKIGDKVPDVTLQNIIRYKAPTASLSDFKGKLIIIDFWATWCVPCVREMPSLDSLQHRFQDQIVILPVTSEKTEIVLAAIKNIPSLKSVGLPFITQDVKLRALFPYNSVPHDIIIDKNGIVKAITSAENISDENIKEILRGASPKMQFKRTLKDFNFERPFLDTIGETVLYRVLITDYYEGLLSTVSRRPAIPEKPDTMLTGTNMRLMGIYKIALERSFRNEISDNRIRLFVKDTSKFIKPKNLSVSDAYQWEKRNDYCFNVIIPKNSHLNVYDELKYNLDRYFNYTSKLDKQPTKCLVIKSLDSNKYKAFNGIPLIDKGKSLWTFKNMTMDGIVFYINEHSDLPIVNDTGYKGKVDISLFPFFNDISSFKKQLNKFGLYLVEDERIMDVITIADNK